MVSQKLQEFLTTNPTCSISIDALKRRVGSEVFDIAQSFAQNL